MPRLSECYRGGYQGRTGWWIAFSYDVDAVVELKSEIPHTERTWDAFVKRWWVSQEYEDVLRRLFPMFATFADQHSLFGEE